MEIAANLETRKDGDIPQAPRLAGRSATLHAVVGGAFNRPKATGASVSDLAASCITTAPNHAGVEP